MRFNRHFNLEGRHAFLSASNNAWSNYNEDKLDQAFITRMAAQRGSDEHAFAAEAIRLGIKLPKTKATLNMYVNDCIGFRMTPEQPLYYTDNAFGTADAISFRKERNHELPLLRVFDLKTGVTHTSVRQLELYATFFCLEYMIKPFDIETELRIYQSNEIRIYEADPDRIFHLMDKTIAFNKRIERIKEEALA